MQNMSYCIEDTVTKHAVIVDPTWEVEKILTFIKDNQFQLVELWLTHAHYDHIQGIDLCYLDYPNIPLCVHELESDTLELKYNVNKIQASEYLLLGESKWQIIFTPGHSPGGVCFYNAPYLITGDTLFINGCGRADIAGANVNDLFQSLQKIKTLPMDTQLFPGHDYGDARSDVLELQLKKNRFLKAANLSSFVKLRMG